MAYSFPDAPARAVANGAIGNASPGGLRLSGVANTALTRAAQLWFVVAVAGQWMFAFYVAAFYGGSAVRGDLDAWNKVLPRGHVAGDSMGNTVLAIHLLFAIVVLVGGPLQLIPHLRTYAPAFHRWNGRVYIPTVFTLSLGGLYLVWVRGGAAGDVSQHVGVSMNGLLIMLCAVMAWRHAVARELAAHRRWALRLFLVVSGVWFFRVGLMLWLIINGGPVGYDPKTFQGPFLSFLVFAQYLLPLAILELYMHVKGRGQPSTRLAMAGGLLVATVATGIGIFAATLGMWLPNL